MLSNSYIDKSDLTIHRPNDTRASQKIVHYYTKRLKTFNLNRYLLPNILQWLVTTTKKEKVIAGIEPLTPQTFGGREGPVVDTLDMSFGLISLTRSQI